MILEKGSKGSAVAAIQEMLNHLHYEGRRSTSVSAKYDVLEVDGIFGEDTEDAVLMFQADNGLYTDGRVGPVTLAALERAFNSRQLELSSPLALPGSAGFTIEKGPADAYKQGYTTLRLRSDVMNAYRQVYKEAHEQGALLTSSGGIRDLDAKVTANRSATSFHYSGRALDLFVWSGMVDPAKDPYVAQRLGDRRYRVFARCLPERASAGAVPPSRTIKDVVTYSSRTKGVSVSGHFLDMTELFGRYGFKPIRARKAFEGGGDPLGAEWWHFQWETGLIPGVSTFGDELLKIYPKSRLISSPPWAYRDYVWQKDWF